MIVGQGNYKYEMQADWLKMPNQWKGSMAAVTVDSKDHIYAFNRGDIIKIIRKKDCSISYRIVI
jgi:hypothetical protein